MAIWAISSMPCADHAPNPKSNVNNVPAVIKRGAEGEREKWRDLRRILRSDDEGPYKRSRNIAGGRQRLEDKA